MTEPTALLELAGLSRSFGGVSAVSDLSMTVTAGTLHAVIGPNGAGKSTLFGMISGRILPDRGSVVFDGEAISRFGPVRRARAGISITYQTPPVFAGMTVRESVMLGAHRLGRSGYWSAILRLSRDRADRAELGERADLAIERLQLTGIAGRESGSLSFGEQRRVQLARALASEPRVLLMDEPASGLHRGERRAFAELLAELASTGLTVLLVEHDVDLVMSVSDTITVMHLGSKLAEGAPADVRRNPAVIAAYLGGTSDE